MKRNLQEAVDNFIRTNGANCSLWIERLSERGEATSYAAETQLPAASLAKLLIVDTAISGRSIDDLDVPVTTIAELRTQLFSTTFGADFRCVVAENMRTTGAWISGGEVSTLGPAPSMISSVDLVQGLPVDLHVRYDAPLQSGSTIGFHLTRAVD